MIPKQDEIQKNDDDKAESNIPKNETENSEKSSIEDRN